MTADVTRQFTSRTRPQQTNAMADVQPTPTVDAKKAARYAKKAAKKAEHIAAHRSKMSEILSFYKDDDAWSARLLTAVSAATDAEYLKFYNATRLRDSFDKAEGNFSKRFDELIVSREVAIQAWRVYTEWHDDPDSTLFLRCALQALSEGMDNDDFHHFCRLPSNAIVKTTHSEFIDAH